LLSDTVINEAPFEVNFGADKNSGQGVNTPITLSAESYNTEGAVTYDFKVNGNTIQSSSSSSVVWKPTETGSYEISVTATNAEGKTVEVKKDFDISDFTYVVLKGDVDSDGEVTVTDATIIQKYLCKFTNDYGKELIDTSDSDVFYASDYNGDGEIDIRDATGIQKAVAQS
jgi:hypothetical protein